MHQLRATQIKMARAYLDWSQDDLASATGLSVATIRNLEMGFLSPRNSTTNIIRRVIETAGLEFIEPDGVRRRLDDVKIYEGIDSTESFYEDLINTVKRGNGGVSAIMKTQDVLIEALGLMRKGNPSYLERLINISEINCLLSGAETIPVALPGTNFRRIDNRLGSPIPYFIYGDKQALVLCEGRGQFKFVVFQSVHISQSYKEHFVSLWKTAMPFFVHDSSTPRD